MYEAKVTWPDGSVMENAGTIGEIIHWANVMANENPDAIVDIQRKDDAKDELPFQ